MKRLVIILVLAILVGGSVFGQNHWIQGEVSLLGGGVKYEFAPSPMFSVFAFAHFNSLFFIWNDFAAGAGFRFFPMSGTFFMELGLGYSWHTGIGDYEIVEEGYSFVGNDWVETKGFGIIPGLGWRIDVGNPGGFYVQPGLKVPITLGKQVPIIDWFGFEYEGEFGVGFGFIMYCGFGYTF